MTGFNLPPGVSNWMLPGNSKGEQDEEALGDAVFDMLAGKDLTNDDHVNAIVQWISKLRGDAYSTGYNDGMADECMAWEYRCQRKG